MRFPFLLFLLAACGSPAQAAPPKLVIPAEVKPVGGYVRFTPDTDAVSVIYVSLDGLDPFPSEELKDPRRFLLPTAGVKDAKYRFVAIAASATGEQTRADFVVPIGTGTAPPTKPTDPPPVTDPPTTPVPTGKLFFAIVRPDGPAQPAFTKAMGLAEWDTLRAAGHSVKDYTLTDVERIKLVVPDGTRLPAVFTLQTSADGKSSRKVAGPVDLPTTAAPILDLPKAVK